MFKQKFLIYRAITLLGDLIILNSGFLISLYFSRDFKSANENEFAIKISLWVTVAWIYLGYSFKLYNANRIERFEQSFNHLFRTLFIHVLVIFSLVFILKSFELTRDIILQAYLLFIPFDLIWRLFLIFWLRNTRNSTDHFRTAIIVGSGAMASQMLKILQTHKGYGYKVLGVFDDSFSNETQEIKIDGDINAAQSFCEQNNIEDIFCALPLTETSKITQLLSFAEKHLIRFKIVPDFTAIHNKPFAIDYYGFVPVISPAPEPLSNYFNNSIKRIFDILFSLLVIVLILSWLTPIVGIALWIESRGPIFYLQNRSGLNYKTFRILKFRTMNVTETDEQFIQAKKNDPRVTRLGKFLRKYNIDELPQFINVFIGNMSIVGPRPHPLKLNEEYKSIVSKYMIRHLVKPGVTGLAQARGFRGETANHDIMEKRIVADVFYIENWSFLLDIKIILLTIINMIKGDKKGY
ncbi:undecaprenyl-phosphate glucose phosphotransferase [Bacteroidota bacterium]|nr:undecaprenyl-phosphate glucose phosphotransferase [Bacteroidota bacterium]